MPTAFSSYTNGDMRLDTNGDVSLLGMMGNTKPNLVPDNYCYRSVNKRFVNGTVTDRGGHFCSILLNTETDGLSVPSPKPTVYAAIEYGIPNTQLTSTTTAVTPKVSAAMVFCSSSAYIVRPGTFAQPITYPNGFTLSDSAFAIQANNVVILFPGQGIAPIQYDATSATSPFSFTTMPTATSASYDSIAPGKHAVWFNNRLWVLDDDTVHISNINDPYTYDPLNDWPIERGTNDTGTALYKWNSNTIIVFKQRSVYYLTGIDDSLENIVLDSISTEVGCISPRGIVNTKDDMYFFSGDAIYSIKLAYSTQIQASKTNFADPVLPYFGQINGSYASGVQMTVYNNRLFMALPINGSKENNAVLVYNFINQAWEGMDKSQSTTDLTYNNSAFNIQSWVYMPFLGTLHLFAVSRAGYLFLYDYDTCDLNDTISASMRYPATSEFISRGYCGAQSEAYGQTYGAGTLNKFAEQVSFHLLSFAPTYSVSVLNDRVNDVTTFLTNKTYSNLTHTQWRQADWTPDNSNNDFNNPNRNDYSINLLANPMYLWSGVYPQLRQGYALPFRVYGDGAYFMLSVTNTGGNTTISNIEVSSLTKENTFSRSA